MQYNGGKNGSGVYQRLICMIPPHRVFVEMFLGSGAILRRKRPAALSYAYELDRRTIREFAKHLPADRFEAWTINAEWNGRDALPGCGGTSIGFNEPGTLRANLEIYNVDAFEELRAKFVASSYFWGLHDPADVVVYCDPPYPEDVRSCKKPIYKFELMAAAEHDELCSLLLALPCKVILSGYDNELYNDRLRGWRKESIPTTNRAGSRVIESVWLNFPEPVELHDYAHVGNDYRDRWRMEKRLRNWTGQLIDMKPAERGAMLERLAAAMDEHNAAGRERDAAATAKRIRKAAAAEKKLKASTRRPTTPDPASKPAKEQELF